MYEASFSEVIRVILIVLLIYFGLKLIIRWFVPMLVRYIVRKVGKQFEKKFNQYERPDRGRNRKKEGEVTIEKKPKNRRKSNNDVGEYIDYEEID